MRLKDIETMRLKDLETIRLKDLETMRPQTWIRDSARLVCMYIRTKVMTRRK